MNILLAFNEVLPATTYGGRQRIVWWLAKELTQLGHAVTLLVAKGSSCPFAAVRFFDTTKRLEQQIPDGIDMVHIHHPIEEPLDRPYLFSIAGNASPGRTFAHNAVFVSRDHAERHGATTFVYNGIDPKDYGSPELSNKRNYVHFLARAAWKVKNIRGAIKVARKSGHILKVMGGTRFNFHMGIRLTFDPRMRFYGLVGGDRKNEILQGSKALLFPVRWPEPFGIALIESLYFGCPVIGTPYGSLPELIPEHVGFLSADPKELVRSMSTLDQFDRLKCQEHVLDNFTSSRMAMDFVELYQRVLDGEQLNAQQPVSTFGHDKVLLPFS